MSAISDALDALEAKITNYTTVQQSGIELLHSLAAQIRENANAPQKLAELAAQIDAHAESMTAAIEANTV